MKTGAKLLIESLQREGVDTLFGYPGGSVLPIYDELYDSPLRHILVRHEQAAAHAADGYARASGRVGVCLATSGPGACNLVTGIATAYMDSVPVVAITGQVPTTMLGNDAFQESDIQGITIPVTKHNYLVKETSDIPRVVKEAFYIAGTGRQGPVLIDLPKDVNTRSVKEPVVPEKVVLRGYNPTYKGHKRQIDKAIELITAAERPLIYAGGGVISSNASPELVGFASAHGIPVTTTLMGLGCIPCDHPLNLGMLGMHGTEYANFAVTECDLLIAIGARFDDRVTGRIETFAPHAKVIHIDIDPAEIGKNKRVDVPIVGDIKSVLTDVIAGLAKKNACEAWQKRIKHWKQHHPLRYGEGERMPAPAVHPPADERITQRRRGYRLRGGPEPDVDRPVLLLPPSPHMDHVRRPWHYGLRLPRGHRSTFCPTRCAGLRCGRRREHPDEYSGNGHGSTV